MFCTHPSYLPGYRVACVLVITDFITVNWQSCNLWHRQQLPITLGNCNGTFVVSDSLLDDECPSRGILCLSCTVDGAVASAVVRSMQYQYIRVKVDTTSVLCMPMSSTLLIGVILKNRSSGVSRVWLSFCLHTRLLTVYREASHISEHLDPWSC